MTKIRESISCNCTCSYVRKERAIQDKLRKKIRDLEDRIDRANRFISHVDPMELANARSRMEINGHNKDNS